MTTTMQNQTPAKRQRWSREKRKEQLLGVSLNIIREHGTDAVTHAKVAKQACVAKTVVYNHFPNRDALLEALVVEYSRPFHENINSHIAHKADNLEQAISILCTVFADSVEETGARMHAFSAAATASLSLQNTWKTVRDQTNQNILKHLQGFAKFPADDGRIAANAISKIGNELGAQYLDGEISKEQFITHSIRLATAIINEFQTQQ